MKPSVVKAPTIIKYPHKLVCGNDVRIGPFCFLNCSGGMEIGSKTRIGPHCIIHSADHLVTDKISLSRNKFKFEKTIIGKGCLISADCTILRGSVIPDFVIIGAGCIIDRRTKLESGNTYVSDRSIKKIIKKENNKMGRGPHRGRSGGTGRIPVLKPYYCTKCDRTHKVGTQIWLKHK